MAKTNKKIIFFIQNSIQHMRTLPHIMRHLFQIPALNFLTPYTPTLPHRIEIGQTSHLKPRAT